MADFTLYFDCEPGADTGRLQQDLQAGLQQLSKVASAETSTSNARFTGLELLAAITLAASIVHQGRNLIDDLRAIFDDVSALSQKLGVKQVSVPVGMEPKPVTELTDDDYQTIAQEIIESRQPGEGA
jgi:hypothetical protein